MRRHVSSCDHRRHVCRHVYRHAYRHNVGICHRLLRALVDESKNYPHVSHTHVARGCRGSDDRCVALNRLFGRRWTDDEDNALFAFVRRRTEEQEEEEEEGEEEAEKKRRNNGATTTAFWQDAVAGARFFKRPKAAERCVSPRCFRRLPLGPTQSLSASPSACSDELQKNKNPRSSANVTAHTKQAMRERYLKLRKRRFEAVGRDADRATSGQDRAERGAGRRLADGAADGGEGGSRKAKRKRAAGPAGAARSTSRGAETRVGVTGRAAEGEAVSVPCPIPHVCLQS